MRVRNMVLNDFFQAEAANEVIPLGREFRRLLSKYEDLAEENTEALIETKIDSTA